MYTINLCCDSTSMSEFVSTLVNGKIKKNKTSTEYKLQLARKRPLKIGKTIQTLSYLSFVPVNETHGAAEYK